MKFKALCFFASLLFLIDAEAQNLVPNPSFEEYSECPTTLDGMHYVGHWFKSIQYPGVPYFENPSPDYFNECAEGTPLGVPENVLGTQNAFLGQAYSGLGTSTISFPEYREVMGVELVEPLVPGNVYYLSMRVSLAIGSTTGWASNKLGMKLSMNEIYTNSESIINNFSHIFSDDILTDTVNWTLIQGIVVADESYQFLHIGNFFSAAETETELIGGPFDDAAYYYIDDVNVIDNSIVGFENKIEFVPIQLGPNPVNNELWVRSNYINANAKVYDLNGKLISEHILQKRGVHNVKVDLLNKGIYILKVVSDNGEIQTEKFIKY